MIKNQHYSQSRCKVFKSGRGGRMDCLFLLFVFIRNPKIPERGEGIYPSTKPPLTTVLILYANLLMFRSGI